MSLGLFLMLLLNFCISWFNAWSVARSWADSKVIGGWTRFVTWCGAIMSAAGFTWCYTTIVALTAGATGYLGPKYVQAVLELGYVVMILPLLGSGLGIWIDSMTTACRRRDLLSVGGAAWNSYAQIHNTYQAATVLPGVFKHLTRVFGEGDGDRDSASGRALMLVLVLVLFALCGGVLTTMAIIRSVGRDYSREVIKDITSK